ncbi:hypothetical protein SAMN04488564_104895 [Lentzea waywayandensis]|uniref:Uncharacterized protein n=1 Tax=Lentzea waywayandensis TaxID=84724 RepID=A0A1I6EM33_9PSEU|nr:hypothetical protein [Lentzea waywayandensis]SFR18697.1 hypothetical protein SAMN04488564_104895 [Lentzea waywayandensis]
MSLEAKLALAALIVAVVAIPIAVWTTRQYGTRRKKLLFLFEATSLMPEIKGSAANALKITYHDIPVDDPHLLTIRLENVGPSDIASNHFDSGKPVQVRLNSTLYGMLSATQPEHTVGPAMGTADAVVELTPLLFKRKDTWVVEVLVSGNPHPELVSTLVDTDVVAETVSDRLVKANQHPLVEVLDVLLGSVLVGATAGLLGGRRRR